MTFEKKGGAAHRAKREFDLKIKATRKTVPKTSETPKIKATRKTVPKTVPARPPVRDTKFIPAKKKGKGKR